MIIKYSLQTKQRSGDGLKALILKNKFKILIMYL